MSDHLLTFLADNPIFAQLNEEQRALVESHALHRQYRAGEFIAYYGDEWPYLFMVGRGQIDGLKESSEGRQLIVMTLRPGEVFWGLAFFNDGMGLPVALMAREQSEVYLWSRDELLPILLEAPEGLWYLCKQMILRMNQASRIVEGLAFHPVSGRLARFLLDLFSEAGAASVERDLTLDEIAARVGSTREMVCRALYQFADKDLIHITRTNLSLKDADGLVKVADQE